MTTPTLRLRPIDWLLDQAFIIPSYQRGYRWSRGQVTELLDDLDGFRDAKEQAIKEFLKGGRAPSASSPLQDVGRFYCLQPVVVLSRGTDTEGRPLWELIDGQQRLTTLLLILRYLEAQRIRVRRLFTLSYETRTPAFLESLDKDLRWETPDAHHMCEAYEAIRGWFDDHPGVEDTLSRVLLDPGDDDINTRVIWYQLPDPSAGDAGHDDRARRNAAIAAFIRLNAGKIRLTDAELIRALFLKSSNFDSIFVRNSQLKIAQEWDLIEKRLQDERFWYFLHGSASPFVTRIDFIFRAYLLQEKSTPGNGEFDLFRTFQKIFHRDKKTDQSERGIRLGARRWRDIKHLAQRLEEWEQDRVLYHLVGYRGAVTSRETGTDQAGLLVDLLGRRKARKLTHTGFEESIKAEIFASLFPKIDRSTDAETLRSALLQVLGRMSYGNDRIRPLLLLFNIATLLRNSASRARFPFDLFQTQSWDIEHIRSVENSKPKTPQDRRRWLAVVIEYWTGRPPDELDVVQRVDLADQSTSLLFTEARDLFESVRIDPKAFDDLYGRIMDHMGESLDVDDSLGNLTLLDSRTNRSYKNAPFPVKRRRVLDLDRSATFVPRCTTNVFSKRYSRKLDQMLVWSERCAEDYVADIAETLAAFFVPGGHRPEVGHG